MPRPPPGVPSPQLPGPQQVPLLFFDATRDTITGNIYIKVVNQSANAQPVHVTLTGLKNIEPVGETITLAANSPDETNTITEPNKIAPVTAKAEGLGADFTKSFQPYSITVLSLKTK
jgi:alpha-N-arabinofuranosidase